MSEEMWQVILRDLIVPLMALILVPLITAVFSALGRRALLLLEQKWGIEVSEKQKLALDQLILESVLYAEEQARKRLLNEKDTVSGAEKMRMALAHLGARSSQLGLDRLVSGYTETIRDTIEARLFAERADPLSPVPERPIEQKMLAAVADADDAPSEIRTGPQLLMEDTAADVKPLDSERSVVPE